jgi:hypothetical protein
MGKVRILNVTFNNISVILYGVSLNGGGAGPRTSKLEYLYMYM